MGEYDVPKTGKIRLKGESKVKKKKKKDKRIKDDDRERLLKEFENGKVKEPEEGSEGAQVDTRTKAQKDFDERRRKKLEQEMEKGPKSFSQRLNEYNEYLASLTDQNDMPKVSTRSRMLIKILTRLQLVNKTMLRSVVRKLKVVALHIYSSSVSHIISGFSSKEILWHRPFSGHHVSAFGDKGSIVSS
uniref:ARAD1C29656p n=1 Tax=Blastobotrys adeninivorans TaxID=409370 RepID=A0A060T2P4_BLAAD